MSLIGNLEDLSLPDILQIISLSKKSGVLVINRGEEEGLIYLREGKVTLTRCAKNRRNIGDILLDKGIINKQQLDDAVEAQKQGDMKVLLGLVFVKMGMLDQETLEKIVQEQIEESVFYLLTWREGTFKFDIKDVDARFEVGVDPQVLISQKGIDTQWLVLEGTRLLDEHRHKESLDGEEKLDSKDILERPEHLKSIILVDDDDFFADRFTKAASKFGISVEQFSGVVESKKFISSLTSCESMAAVVDVVMPTSDGRGFLGGVELAGFIKSEHPEMNLMIITAYPDDSIHEELKKLNVPPYTQKPDIAAGNSDSDAMEEFLKGIFRSYKTTPQRVPSKEKPSPITNETMEKEGIPTAEEIDAALKNLYENLEDHPSIMQVVKDLAVNIQTAQNPSEIGLSILRLASEILERAILFKASGNQAASLGGFGFEAQIMENRDGLRNLSINLDNSESLLLVVRNMLAVKSTTHVLSKDDLLYMVLGEPIPSSWIIIPAKGVRDSVLILYGDNGTSKSEIREEKMLSQFLILAGMIMNKLDKEITMKSLSAVSRAAGGHP